jgi:hypothetical protein
MRTALDSLSYIICELPNSKFHIHFQLSFSICILNTNLPLLHQFVGGLPIAEMYTEWYQKPRTDCRSLELLPLKLPDGSVTQSQQANLR